MRTTLTLDPDVAERLASETRRTGKSLKALVNDAIRLGLGLTGRQPKSPRFTVEPHAFGLRPGIDPDRLNQLIDELEVADAARRLSHDRPDVNLLIHAYNSESRVHQAACAWWEALLNGTQPVGLSWVAALGFIRLTTHRQILANPLTVSIACAHVAPGSPGRASPSSIPATARRCAVRAPGASRFRRQPHDRRTPCRALH